MRQRKNTQLRLECDIFSFGATWLASETGAVPSGVLRFITANQTSSRASRGRRHGPELGTPGRAQVVLLVTLSRCMALSIGLHRHGRQRRFHVPRLELWHHRHGCAQNRTAAARSHSPCASRVPALHCLTGASSLPSASQNRFGFWNGSSEPGPPWGLGSQRVTNTGG